MLIQGDIARDVFKDRVKFNIVNAINQGVEPEYDLIEENNYYKLKLIIKRNNFLFESAFSQLNCKISKNITIDISQSKINETHQKENINLNQQNVLSKLFPNFVSIINESAVYLKNVEKRNDNSKILEYRVPILTFGQVIGYDFYTIEKDDNNNFYFYQYRISEKGVSSVYSSKKRITKCYTNNI